MSIKLFIGGFPLDMDEMGLAQLIAPHGNIEIMKIVRDKKTRVAKGYAFVEMASERDAVAVMAALDGEPIGDRQFSVKLAAAPVIAQPLFQKVARSGAPEKKLRPRRPRV
jgi:RNA recognition motif-containing protein